MSKSANEEATCTGGAGNLFERLFGMDRGEKTPNVVFLLKLRAGSDDISITYVVLNLFSGAQYCQANLPVDLKNLETTASYDPDKFQ